MKNINSDTTSTLNLNDNEERNNTMKTIYGDTETTSEPACPNCEHRKIDKNGKFYCELYPEMPENELEEDAPRLFFSIFHGTYGNVHTSSCDCDDFSEIYDGE